MSKQRAFKQCHSVEEFRLGGFDTTSAVRLGFGLGATAVEKPAPSAGDSGS